MNKLLLSAFILSLSLSAVAANRIECKLSSSTNHYMADFATKITIEKVIIPQYVDAVVATFSDKNEVIRKCYVTNLKKYFYACNDVLGDFAEEAYTNKNFLDVGMTRFLRVPSNNRTDSILDVRPEQGKKTFLLGVSPFADELQLPQYKCKAQRE